jgi:hypothetical protein
MKQISSAIRAHADQVSGILFIPDFPKNKFRVWLIAS